MNLFNISLMFNFQREITLLRCDQIIRLNLTKTFLRVGELFGKNSMFNYYREKKDYKTVDIER